MATSVYEIIAYNYGDVLRNALEGTKYVVNSDAFKGLMLLGITVYFLKFIFELVDSKIDVKNALIKFLIPTIIISALNYKIDIAIYDKADPAKSAVVNKFPAMIGFPLWVANVIENEITSAFEAALSLPNGVRYTQLGYAGGIKNLHDAAYYAQISNKYLQESIIRYSKDCIMAALLDGSLDPKKFRTEDLVKVIEDVGTLEPARFTVYYSSSFPEGEVKTCEDAAALIKNDIDTDKKNTLDSLAASLGYTGTTASLFKTLLTDEFSFYYGISNTAADTLFRQALVTTVNDALIQTAGELGVNPDQIGLSLAKAKEKSFLTNVTAGEQLREFLPTLRMFLQIVAATAFPILIAIGFITGNPFKYIGIAISVFFFPVFWGILGALINMYLNTNMSEIQSLIAALSPPGSNTINIADYPYIMMKIKDTLATAGWLSMMIPSFSFVLMSGSAFGFARLVGGLTSGVAGAAAAGAAGLESGNVSVGNVSDRNASYNNFGANSYSAGAKFSTQDLVNTTTDVSMGRSLKHDGVLLTPTVSYGVTDSGTSTDHGEVQHKVDTGNTQNFTNAKGVGKSYTDIRNAGKHFGVNDTANVGKNWKSQTRFTKGQKSSKDWSILFMTSLMKQYDDILLHSTGTDAVANLGIGGGGSGGGGNGGGSDGLASRLAGRLSLIPGMKLNFNYKGSDKVENQQRGENSYSLARNFSNDTNYSEQQDLSNITEAGQNGGTNRAATNGYNYGKNFNKIQQAAKQRYYKKIDSVSDTRNAGYGSSAVVSQTGTRNKKVQFSLRLNPNLFKISVNGFYGIGSKIPPEAIDRINKANRKIVATKNVAKKLKDEGQNKINEEARSLYQDFYNIENIVKTGQKSIKEKVDNTGIRVKKGAGNPPQIPQNLNGENVKKAVSSAQRIISQQINQGKNSIPKHANPFNAISAVIDAAVAGISAINAELDKHTPPGKWKQAVGTLAREGKLDKLEMKDGTGLYILGTTGQKAMEGGGAKYAWAVEGKDGKLHTYYGTKRELINFVNKHGGFSEKTYQKFGINNPYVVVDLNGTPKPNPKNYSPAGNVFHLVGKK